MSSEAIGWVFRYSPYRGTAFTVHLAIADSVNDQNDNEFWMRQTVLARKARTSRKSVGEAIAAMLADALLDLVEEGKGGANRYRFLTPSTPDVFGPMQRGVTRRGTPRSAKPASSGGTPATSGDAGDATSGGTEPKVSEPNGDQGSAGAAPEQNAGTILAGFLDYCDAHGRPRPGNVGMVAKNVKSLLNAGHEPGAIKRALVEAPTGTIPALEMILNRSRPGPSARIDEDRDRPSGRLSL